jgi:hypothetical protein
MIYKIYKQIETNNMGSKTTQLGSVDLMVNYEFVGFGCYSQSANKSVALKRD